MHSPTIWGYSALYEAESGDTWITPGEEEEGRGNGADFGRVYLSTPGCSAGPVTKVDPGVRGAHE